MQGWEDCHTSIFIRGKLICNLCFADDTDLMVGSNSKLLEIDLTNRLTMSMHTVWIPELTTAKSWVTSIATENMRFTLKEYSLRR